MTVHSAQVEALDVFVDVLSEVDADAPRDEFYGRLCEAICRLTSMQRAVIFRYDSARRRVRAAGTYGLERELFADLHATVESAPLARRALEQDRVVEVLDLEGQVPSEYATLLRGRQLTCTPMAAAGRWVGVVLSDRAPDAPPLGEAERPQQVALGLPEGRGHLLWTLGKTAALAAIARIATTQSEKARQLEQRIDMAREIHDGVIQRLFGVSLALAADHELDPESRRRCASELQGALADLRSALQRPLGRTARPTRGSLAEELDRLARAHPDLAIVAAEPAPVVPPALEPLAQSVLAEAVRNAHRHAHPSRVEVRAGCVEGAFVLSVRNDGVRGRSRRSGVGLRLAALEALQLGGVVEFGEREPGTWEVKLVVPDGGA